MEEILVQVRIFQLRKIPKRVENRIENKGVYVNNSGRYG